MIGIVLIVFGVMVIGLAGLIAWWQLAVAEGAYLGRRVVAFLYDRYAGRYDQVKQFHPANDAVMLAMPILEHLATMGNRQAEVRVLDVATGTGRLPAVLLGQSAFRGRIVALDISPKMLEQAQAKLSSYAGRVEWMRQDAQHLPFQDASFDVVTCLEAIEFFPRPFEAVAELARVLKPGGLLMVSNRVGPDAWKLPGRAMPSAEFAALLSRLGLVDITIQHWLVDYDLLLARRHKDQHQNIKMRRLMTHILHDALQYAEARRDLFVAQLSEYLSIPSVSAQPQHSRDIKYAALWLADHLRELGLRAEIYETGSEDDPGHPVVFAEWQHTDPHRPTLLIYGHYDVQPADPIEEWESGPFEPAIRDGYIYARGASDNKGQHMAHIKAVESLLKTAGTLPVNVKFLIEGEEEIGGTHLGPFIAGHAELLACDAIVISDSSLISPTQPALVYGLRGLVYFEVEARCASHDLHSGTYGGNVQNPLMALAQILARLKDAQGRVLVPGFYDDVRTLDAAEREALARAPLSEAGILAQTGASAIFGEAGFSIAERMGARPTLEINGLWGGYTRPGAKTVLPATAYAKISCRLVPYQEPEKVVRAVTDYMRQVAPPATTLAFRALQGGSRATLIARDSPYMQAAARAAKATYGYEPVWMLEGGSLPVVNDFQSVLGKPVILLGFGLEGDRLHAPNERFALTCYQKGIEAGIRLLCECQ